MIKFPLTNEQSKNPIFAMVFSLYLIKQPTQITLALEIINKNEKASFNNINFLCISV